MTESSPLNFSLDTRAGLPEELRFLLADYPREAWESDPHFSGLVAFWLQMHQGFRKGLALMQDDAQQLLDAKLDPKTFAHRLQRVGGQFVDHLHGHHHIEDDHYFPLLVAREKRLQRGFDILDRDHHQLTDNLETFVGMANAMMRATNERSARDQAGAFQTHLAKLETFLHRHLTDEEDLIVPVILRHGESGIG
jgi:iron-sulfur cluster repair protein YtfE (RIC family)